MRKLSLAILSFIMLVFLSSCGRSIEEKLFTTFEEASQLEEKLPEYNQSLIELEGIDSALFNQIISEGKSSNTEIQDTIDNALKNCEDRKVILENESKVMKASYDKSVEAKKNINKIDDGKIKKQGEKVQKLFNDRYYTFTLIEENYNKTIVAEQELYNLLKAEKQNLRDIEDSIAKINGLYEVNRNKQASFTELSVQLNNEKNIFYELMGIKLNEETSES